MAEDKNFGPKIKPIDSTSLLKAAQSKVFKDTGITLPGSQTTGIEGKRYNDGLAVAKEKSPEKKNKQSGSFGQALSSNTAQGIYKGIGAVTDIGTQFIDRDTTKNPTGFDTQQKIGDALLQSGNPYAMAAGAAYKMLSGIAEATGGNVNTINKNQAKEVGLSGIERIGNNVLGVIPGLG